MNSELNKEFGRDFIIGFFLPALIFIWGASLSLHSFGLSAPWLEIDWHDPLKETALLAVASWIFAVFLQSLNREIFRLAEGYWPWKLRDLCGYFERLRFAAMEKRLAALREEGTKCAAAGREFPQASELQELWHDRVTRFPSKKGLVLPTSFGNVVRAYEDYSRVVYRFESINGWSRLRALMSKEFGDVLSGNRARVDLWLNSFVLMAILAAIVAVDVWRHDAWDRIWLALVLLLWSLVAYTRARNSAGQYGEQVKAAFDVYLPELARKLGYELSADPKKNRTFWVVFSQTMVYPDPSSLERLEAVGLKRIAAAGEAKADDGDEDED